MDSFIGSVKEFEFYPEYNERQSRVLSRGVNLVFKKEKEKEKYSNCFMEDELKGREWKQQPRQEVMLQR